MCILAKTENCHFGHIHMCTMLLEQIKGFYHGIFLLLGSYTMLSWH